MISFRFFNQMKLFEFCVFLGDSCLSLLVIILCIVLFVWTLPVSDNDMCGRVKNISIFMLFRWTTFLQEKKEVNTYIINLHGWSIILTKSQVATSCSCFPAADNDPFVKLSYSIQFNSLYRIGHYFDELKQKKFF